MPALNGVGGGARIQGIGPGLGFFHRHDAAPSTSSKPSRMRRLSSVFGAMSAINARSTTLCLGLLCAASAPISSGGEVGPCTEMILLVRDMFASLSKLDQIVQILRRSQRRVRGQKLVRLHFAHRAVRCSVTVQRDCLRIARLTPDRFREESLGRSDIAPGADPEVDRLSCAVNCTLKIDPFATDFHIRLVDSP